MAHRFEKGKPIFFLFKNGYTVQDSQLKPRYYLDRKKAEEYLPYGDEIVEYAPTVEAEPVKHGRWELIEYQCAPLDTDQALVCSACGYDHQYQEHFVRCPNCGAKMDEEGGDD